MKWCFIMKIESGVNYSVISDNISEKILDNFQEYTIIDNHISYNELIDFLSSFNSRRIVFFDALRFFNNDQKKKIKELLALRKINYVNITSDIEQVLDTDYLYVFSNDKIVLEGKTLEVLKNEKKLKRIGFALPFVVDLSMQLKLYGTLNDIKTDMKELVDELWN